MRILIDECIDEALRHHLTGHQCQTCRYAGLKGLANGHLLAAAEESGFEVLITVDRNMPYQQSLRRGAISLVILQGRTTNLDDLLALIPELLTALEVLKPGQTVRIGGN
jgi:predicted nuclease of predicted toxin-antitoxin system